MTKRFFLKSQIFYYLTIGSLAQASNTPTHQYCVQESTSSSSKNEDDSLSSCQQVTIHDYCHFLNTVAREDPHELYDKKMASDPTAACILRLGGLGNYSYQVIEQQKGEAAVTFVSYNNAARYCNWRENRKNSDERDSEITEHGIYEFQHGQIMETTSDEISLVLQDQGTLISSQKVDDLNAPIDRELKSNQLNLNIQTSPNLAVQAGIIETTAAETSIEGVVESVVITLSAEGIARAAEPGRAQETERSESRERIPARLEVRVPHSDTPGGEIEITSPRHKARSRVQGRIDEARQFERQQSILTQLRNNDMDTVKSWKKEFLGYGRQSLTEREKRGLIRSHFFQAISEEKGKHLEFEKKLLAEDASKVDPWQIRSDWNKISFLKGRNRWDNLIQLIEGQIRQEQRDNNAQHGSQWWSELFSRVEQAKNFWHGDFWPEYWSTYALRIQAEDLIKKDQLLFEETMKELDFSDSDFLESLNEDIISAETIHHIFEAIVTEQQAASKKDTQFSREFYHAIRQAEGDCAYWKIQVLRRKALKESEMASCLEKTEKEKALSLVEEVEARRAAFFVNKERKKDAKENLDAKEKFEKTWEDIEAARSRAEGAWRAFKEAMLTRREQLKEQNGLESLSEEWNEWLNEIEDTLIFLQCEVSWNQALKAEMIAACAAEKMYINFSYQNVLKEQVKEAIKAWGTVMQVQIEFITKVSPLLRIDYQEKYKFGYAAYNHWKEFVEKNFPARPFY